MPSQSATTVPWPEEYAALEGVLLNQLGGESRIVILRTISEGKSGALVMVVDVSSESFTGQAILKLDQTRDSRRNQALEYERHEKAFEVAPEYAAEYLPKLVCAARQGNQVAALTTIAGRGLEYAMAWSNCSYGPQLETAIQLSEDLLERWNVDYVLDPDVRTPQHLLSAWLGHRLVRENGGRIHEFVETKCAFDPQAPTFLFDGDWFPNPLAFGNGQVELPETARLRPIRGNQHGDLHGKNVLVTKQFEVDPHYYLIDLDFYRDDGFLFYDHAIFELDYLLTSHETIRPRHWKAMMLNLVRDRPGVRDTGLTGVDIGIIQLVREFRDKPKQWVDRHQPNRLSFLESQHLLARVAAGLAIAHQLRDDRSRALGFLYAAYNVKDYLALHEFEWPKHGPAYAIEKLYENPADTPEATAPLQDIGAGATPATSRPSKLTVAVLDLSCPDAQQVPDQTADSMTDGIISELSRIDWFTTIRRSASQVYKDRETDPQRAGRELQADYVLRGSVRTVDNVLRISIHLIETRSGDEVWSDKFRFDPEIEDQFTNEDIVANAIAAMMNAELARNERKHAMQCDPSEADAWQLFMRARWHFLQVNQDDDELAKQMAQKAIDKAPDYSDPYAQMAQIQNRSIFYGWTDSSDAALASPIDLARRAVSLDPGNSYAHESLARAYMFAGRTSKAVREAETAVSLNPSSSTANMWLALCLVWAGKPAEALPVVDLSLRLGPFDEGLVYKLAIKATAYLLLGRRQKAEELGMKIVETSHGHMIPQLFRALTLGRHGRLEEARQEIQLVLRDRPDMNCGKIRGMMSGMNPQLQERLIKRVAELGLPE